MRSMVLAVVVATVASQAPAQLVPERRQVPSPGFALFGSAIGVSGSTLAAAAVFNNEPFNPDPGVVRLFDIETGDLRHQLRPRQPEFARFFGRSIAIDGDNVLVGAALNFSQNSGGIAYVFDRVTGEERTSFLIEGASDRSLDPQSVALDGTTAVVAAPFFFGDVGGGVAYVFDLTGQRPPSTLFAGNGFSIVGGPNVAADGDIVVQIAQDEDTYVLVAFEPPFGTSKRPFLSIDTGIESNMDFGPIASFPLVAISGDRIAVGVRGLPGRILMYDTQGTPLFEIEAPPGFPNTDKREFPSSLAMSGDRVLVSAIYDSADGVSSGLVYVFDVNSGALREVFYPSDGVENSFLGQALAADGTTVAATVGFNGDGFFPSVPRASYIFEPTEGCAAADLVEPFGVIDLDDADAFIAGFFGGSPEADFVPFVDVLDLADVDAFIAAFLDGCP